MPKRRNFLANLGALLLVGPLKVFTKKNTMQNVQTGDAAFFDISKLEEELKGKENQRYLPFLNVEKLRTGLYVLPKDGTDNQQPHAHDEVYYVLSGKSMFKAGDEDKPVEKGAVLYVKANVEHRFYDIEEELKILVFFSNMT